MSNWLVRFTWILMVIVCGQSVQAMELVHSERSLYRQVLVYKDGDVRYLCFTRNCTIGRQSSLDLKAPDRLVFDYAHMMLGSLFLVPRPQSILVIGLGGGTLPKALAKVLPEASIDVVEIDPAVTRMARQYFQFVPGPRTTIFEEDGRVYVRRAGRAGKSYDLIMLDAYDHEYIPEHMLTREFLQEVKLLLKPGGVLAANTFSSSRLYESESTTYRAVFGEFYNLKAANRIILWRNGMLPALTTVQMNATAVAPALKVFGVDVDEVYGRFSTSADWSPTARVLTDQYSPANLLNGK
jgi:spermidine synthase